jgi:hypothetical protein
MGCVCMGVGEDWGVEIVFGVGVGLGVGVSGILSVGLGVTAIGVGLKVRIDVAGIEVFAGLTSGPGEEEKGAAGFGAGKGAGRSGIEQKEMGRSGGEVEQLLPTARNQ